MNKRQMFIPTIGTEITLAEPWTFGLCNEPRNDQMFAYQGITFPDNYRERFGHEWETYGKSIKDVTLPAGSVLKIDRIYIRKGNATTKEYDSVTFILQSVPDTKIAVKDTIGDYKSDPANYTWSRSKKTITRQKIRFWAKLNDVNNIVFEQRRLYLWVGDLCPNCKKDMLGRNMYEDVLECGRCGSRYPIVLQEVS